MIKQIDKDTTVLDRTKMGEKAKQPYDNKIVLLSEAEYQALPYALKNNGITYLTFNQFEESTTG